jgi:hypothetical protein
MDTQSPAEKRQVKLGQLAQSEDRPARCALNQQDHPRPAEDVPPGQRWVFPDHRTMAEIIAAGLF